MKKITLCAILGTVILSTSALAYKAPQYSLEGAEKKVEYQMGGNVKIIKHAVDRNKDGKIDLIQEEIRVQEQTLTNLYIDDDFDDYADRVLSNKKNGDYGTEVKISDLKIEDFF